jgi:hypothetical protein
MSNMQNNSSMVVVNTPMNHYAYYTYGKYHIGIQLLTNDQLYFLIMHDATYFTNEECATYEKIITNNDLDGITVDKFYKILNRTFQQRNGYEVFFSFGEKKMVLRFKVDLEDIVTLCYEISIDEQENTTKKEATSRPTEPATEYERNINDLVKHIKNLRIPNNKLSEIIRTLENNADCPNGLSQSIPKLENDEDFSCTYYYTKNKIMK